MIIRVSFLVVASFVALKVSLTKAKRNGATEFPECDASHLEHECKEMKDNTVDVNPVTQNEEKQVKIEMAQNMVTLDFDETEILQKLVQNYKQREVNLERKLLELNALKEERSAAAQLRRELERKTAKVNALEVTIASLQGEKRMIGEQIRECVSSKMLLDIANKTIKDMQRKKNDVSGRSLVRDQLSLLQQQVTELKDNGSARNAVVNNNNNNNNNNKKVEDVHGIELEVLQLTRRNKELQLEKREIGVMLANALEKVRTEEEKAAKIKEERTDLLHVHKELSLRVETLQRNRFEMVQELVYQHWLYACLRFEVHHSHNKDQSRALRRRQQHCGHNSSIEEELRETEKPNKDALTYDDELDSYGTDTTTVESFSSRSLNSSNSSSKNSSFSYTQSLEKPIIMQRLKRVSFSDSDKTIATNEDMKEALHDAEQHDDDEVILTSNSSNEAITVAENEVVKNEIGDSDEFDSWYEHVCGKGSKIKTQIVELLVALLFFSLFLLAYFRII